MTTGESAVGKSCADTTVLRFKIDGMQSTIEQLKIRVSEVSEAAMNGMRKAMKAVGMRGPDPDYNEEEDEKRLLIRIIREQARNSSGHGSVNGGGNTNKWILGIVGVLIAGGIFGLTSALFTMTDRISKVETKVDMLIKDRK